MDASVFARICARGRCGHWIEGIALRRLRGVLRLAGCGFIRSATEIIDRLRSLYKKGPPQRELVEVNEIIRKMVELLRAEANQHAVTIRTDLVDNLSKIAADRVQLQPALDEPDTQRHRGH